MLHAGALLDRMPGPKYLEALDFCEFLPAEPLPKITTLTLWRADVPGEVTVALVAPRSCVVSAAGALRFDASLEARFVWLCSAAHAVQARFVVVATASEVTTGQRDRDLLSAYFERFSKDRRFELVWSPRGVWEPACAHTFARRLGVHYGADALEELPTMTGAPIVYARVQGVGGHARLSEATLLEIAERVACVGAAESFVALHSQRSFQEACRLQVLGS